jgi:hypothetical protein
MARKDELLLLAETRAIKVLRSPITGWKPMLLLLPLSEHLQTAGGVLRKKRDSTKRTMKMTNSTCAIQAAVPATPAKPKKPAMMAMTKKMSEYDNITDFWFLPGSWLCTLSRL